MLFMAVVDAGSITKAAEKLNLSKSAISQSLSKLEAELATTLIKRTTRKQSVTSSGQQLYGHCLRLKAILDQAWDEILTQQHLPKGKFTVTAPTALMDIWVLPALTKAFSKYEDLSLEIMCSDRRLDLMDHGIDLAIRVGELPDSNYRQMRLGSFNDILCQAVDAGKHYEYVPYIANHWESESVTHEIGGQKIKFSVKHKTNSIFQTIALIKAKMGVGLVPELLLKKQEGIAPIGVTQKVNVYCLHPYGEIVPISVRIAQAAIKNELHELLSHS